MSEAFKMCLSFGLAIQILWTYHKYIVIATPKDYLQGWSQNKTKQNKDILNINQQEIR